MFCRRQRFKAAMIFAATCLALLATTTARAEPIKLQWKFVAGQKAKYRIVQDMVIDMDVLGQSTKMTMTQAADLTWAVKEVDEQGTADMTQTIDRLRVKLKGAPGADVDYDSAADEEPQGLAALIAPTFSAVVNQPIQVKMSPQGEVQDVVLPKEMSEKLNGMPGMGPIADMFSAANLKQMMGAGILQFSPAAVDRGDSWQTEAEMDDATVGKQHATTAYTYQGLESRNGRRLAKIEIKLELKVSENQKTPAKVTIAGQESSGVAYFDPEASEIVELKLTSKLKTSFSVMGQKLTQTISNTTTMRPAEETAENGASKEDGKEKPE